MANGAEPPKGAGCFWLIVLVLILALAYASYKGLLH